MYGWLITKDLLEGVAEGTMGPRNTSFDKDIIEAKGIRFRMRDDDGEVYYEGRFLASAAKQGTEAEFAPLDNFGMPSAGCTEIQYWRGGWKTL